MLALTIESVRLDAAERFQAIENVSKNGSFGHKILRHNANIYHIRESPRHQTPYQLPMTKSNIPWGIPCNGAAFGAARGRPCVLSSIAQAADTRADSLVPFWAMSANASIATATCPSSNPDSAARMAAVSAFCDPAGRPAPGRLPPCFMD
jgi:hypothetical protein